MQQQPKLKMYITTVNGIAYYQAILNSDGTYNVGLSLDNTPLPSLPQDWQKVNLKWGRNVQYFGIFRSCTDGYKFGNEGRAILKYLFNEGNINAQARLRIDVRQDLESSPGAGDMWRYETIYNSHLDFTKYDDDAKMQICTIGTLDGDLVETMKAYGDNDINIPYWVKDVYDTWVPNDAKFIINDGIMLYWQADWTTAASVSVPLEMYNNINSDRYSPALSLLNNTSYLGNDILQHQLLANNKSSNGNIITFDNYTQSNGIIWKYVIPDTVLRVVPTVTCTNVFYGNPAVGQTLTIQLAIEEINSSNTSSQTKVFAELVIPNNPSFGTDDPLNITNPTFTYILADVDIHSDCTYIMTQRSTQSVSSSSPLITKVFYTALVFSLVSLHSSNLRYPSSPCIGFDLETLFRKIIERLSSVSSDPNGFQLINPDNVFNSISGDALSLTEVNADSIPANIFWTSGNSIRVINGIQYCTISLNAFFKSIFAIYGFGLRLNPDNQNEVGFAEMAKIFESDLLLMDLKSNIANLKIAPLTDYAGTLLQTGYSTKWQDFKQYVGNSTNFYGIDAFNFTQEYKMPITKKKGTIDWIADVIAEPYKIEAERANQSESDSSSPSSSNANYIIEINDIPTGDNNFQDPEGNYYHDNYYSPRIFPSAQPTYPSSPPYVRGLRYPEAMQNLTITPRKNLQRLSPLLHSICDGIPDTSNVVFQKQWWQMYNGNSNVLLSGISTNLLGDLYTEVGDLSITDLGDKLFRPILFKFDTTAPINMYSIMQNNPYGYIQFTWEGNTYKGFIWDVDQNIAENMTTTFTLLATADTII